MEKIKRDGSRIAISKLNPDEVNGDDVTGGYILKFDWYYLYLDLMVYLMMD